MSRNWRCECPICRVLVKRVINKVSSNTTSLNTSINNSKQVVEDKEELIKENRNELNINEIKQKFPVESIKLTHEQTQQNIQSQQNSQMNEKHKEKDNKEKESQIQVEVPKEFVDRIEQLESEVSRIKEYVENNIDNIKAILVDLKSAITELNNPFNILREHDDESFRGKENHILTCKDTSHTIQSLPQHSMRKTSHFSRDSSSLVHVSAFADQEFKRDKVNKVERSMDLDTFSRLAEWVDSVLKKIPSNKLNEIINNYIEVGIISRDLGEALKKIIRIVEELKKHGISVEEQRKVLSKLIENLSQDSMLSKDAHSKLSQTLSGD